VQNAYLVPRTYEIAAIKTQNSFKKLQKDDKFILKTLTPFGSIKCREKL
jgi:hypothetical protein